jgi:hypothetical protein
VKIDSDSCTSTTPTFRMRRRPWPAKHRGERYRSRGVKAPSRHLGRMIARLSKALAPGVSSPSRPWFSLSLPGYDGAEVRQWLGQPQRAMEQEIALPMDLLEDEGKRMREQLAVYRVPDYRYCVRVSNP